MKPKEHADELLDPSDPGSMYFIYICRKTKELVIKKKVKLGRIKKKELQLMRPRGKQVNVKPSAGRVSHVS
ncbi:hypothetical protein EON64_08810 [archaeon]|nr:MAG: hypothetical protein EON64_08810 [archaeon]